MIHRSTSDYQYSENNIPVYDRAVKGIFFTNKTTRLIVPVWQELSELL